MSETEDKKVKVHHGKNVKFAREHLEEEIISQSELAERMGGGFHQSTISTLEGQEVIPDEDLEKIAQALNVPIEFLKNFPLKSVLKKMIKGQRIDINNCEIATVTGDVEQIDKTDPENTAVYLARIETLATKNGQLQAEIKFLKEKYKK